MVMDKIVLSKRQTTSIFICSIFSFLTIGGMLFLFSYLSDAMGISRPFYLIFAVITGSAYMYVFYRGIRRYYTEGETFDRAFLFLDSFGKPLFLKITFWFVAPITIPIFAMMYNFLLAFLIFLVSLPFNNVLDRYIDQINLGKTVACVFMAIITQIQLWKYFKKHFLQNNLKPAG